MTRAIAPGAARLEGEFSSRLRELGYKPLQIRALLAITPVAASRLRTFGQFLEQAEYNGRRLAKLNVAPAAVDELLREFNGLISPVLDGRYEPSREQLQLATMMAVDRAFYQVREAEAQAFFGLHHAVSEASGLDDLLRRFVRILTQTFHARIGRLHLFEQPPSLSRPLYIERGKAAERFIADPEMRGCFASYWSYPLKDAGVIQLGFTVRYPWLPRELTMLEAVAERCHSAIERARLEVENRRLEIEARCAEEEERRRIGRDLHDEAGQSLLWLRLHLELMERDATEALRPRLGEARAVVERTVAELRRIIAALSPAVLERLGLGPAIRRLVERFRQIHSADVRLRVSVRSRQLPMQIQEVIYRVAQECLQNISKHSQAACVNLSLTAVDHSIRLSVSDNGCGMNPNQGFKPASFGLLGMRERAALMGGTLMIQNVPGKGVTVKLQLPVKAAIGE
jgi:signal transduction histidine kinase